MKRSCILSIIFGTLLLGATIGQQFDFDSLTNIASAQVTKLDSLDIANGLLEDDNFIYTFTLSPVCVSKVNKSDMAILGNRFDGTTPYLPVSIGQTVVTGLLFDGYIYLIGQTTIFKVPVDLSKVEQLVFPQDINPTTSFYSQNADGNHFLNFPSYGTPAARFYQVDLNSFGILNFSIHSFPLPTGDFQVSTFDGNRTAYLGTFEGSFYQLDMETFGFTFNFSTRSMSVTSLAVDATRNTLYYCGDYNDSAGPYFIKIDLDNVSNGASLNIPRDPSYRNRTKSNAAVTATYVGPRRESTCKGFSLDTERNQAIVYSYDPPTSSGILLRVNTESMEIIEELPVNTYFSMKVIAGLINTEDQLLYYLTETELNSVFYPANNSVPIRPEPPVAPPQGEPFDRLAIVAYSEVISTGLDQLNGLVEDDNNLYIYNLFPVKLAKVAKSDLALFNNTFDTSFTALQYTGGPDEVALTAVQLQGNVFVFGQSSVIAVQTSSLYQVVRDYHFSFDINPVSSFYSKDQRNSTIRLNVLSSDTLHQLAMETFGDAAPVSYPLPADDFRVSAYDNHVTVHLATFAGDFYKLNMEALPGVLNYFKVSDISVTSLQVDWARNTLYFCGDYGVAEGPYLVKIELDKISFGTTLTLPCDLTYSNRTQTDAVNGISATFVGTTPESTCKGFALDTERDQAIVYEYNPPSTGGQLYRINTETMEIIDELALNTPISRKVVGGLINTEDQLLYLITEKEVLSVFYPSSNAPVDPTPEEPSPQTPVETPFFAIPIASTGHIATLNALALIMSFVFAF